MTRLPFKIPEYAPRTTWASPHAREVWAPRIAAVSQAWQTVERDSVIHGVRPSALQNVTPEALPDLMKTLAPHGVIALPLGKAVRPDGYQSATKELVDGAPWDYRVAITRPEHAAAWAAAWEHSNNDAIGSLLGTPACCRRFFQCVWVEGRWFDPTVPAFRNTEGSLVMNLLWRWHGVRPVSHLPCSFGCVESQALAHKCRQLVPAEAGAWMDAILSWPVKYTSLHGIAEITTPIHRMSVATDALSSRVEIRYLGTGYPEEGAKGVDFPHVSRAATSVPIQLTRPSNPRDNGFSDRTAQDTAHRVLLAALPPGPFGTVLDLGCGDGTLLSKIPATRRVGVEAESARARHARLDRVVIGDCTDRAFVDRVLQDEHPDLVIAQRDRNPPHTLPGQRVLSYSYEAGAEPPALVNP